MFHRVSGSTCLRLLERSSRLGRVLWMDVLRDDGVHRGRLVRCAQVFEPLAIEELVTSVRIDDPNNVIDRIRRESKPRFTFT